jgi:hypothetical protein
MDYGGDRERAPMPRRSSRTTVDADLPAGERQVEMEVNNSDTFMIDLGHNRESWVCSASAPSASSAGPAEIGSAVSRPRR